MAGGFTPPRVFATIVGFLVVAAIFGVGTIYKLRTWGTPQYFGAIAGDNGDDTWAFRQAQAAWKRVRVPFGNYVLSGPIELHDGERWRFDGVTVHVRGPGPAFHSAGARDWSFAGTLGIEGNPETQAGIVIENPRNVSIDRLIARNVAGVALRVTGTAQSLPRSNTLAIDHLVVRNNDLGLALDAGSGAEFVVINQFDALGNKLAASIGAGNAQIHGGNVVDNQNGILLTGGSNNGHGVIEGMTIAHNLGFNLRADGVTNGFTIAATHIYGNAPDEGTIDIMKSTGISIRGGIIDASVKDDGEGKNVVADNFVGGSQFSVSDVPALILHDNFH